MSRRFYFAIGLLLVMAAVIHAQPTAGLLTMTEVPNQPVNGLTVEGVTFGFTIGGAPSTDASYNASNGGQLINVQDPSLEGNSLGVLTIDFPTAVGNLRFGVARSTFSALTPGLSVDLFDGALNMIGTFTLNTVNLVSFSEGEFVAPGNALVRRAVLSFPNAAAAPRFAIDNLAWGVPYQVNYSSNLNVGDSVINITNTGTNGAALASGTSASTTGALCVNVYAFSPDEQMIACCSCPVTPNGLVSLSARSDLISNTLTPAVPTSIVVKLLATVPMGGTCANSASSAASLASGIEAFGTKLHAAPGGGFGVTETAFLNGSLSGGELSRLRSLCTFITANGSGFGICRTCRLGGLGSDKQ